MRKLLVVSAMGLLGLLALGTDAVRARALPDLDAHRFTEHDVQAPLHEGDFQLP